MALQRTILIVDDEQLPRTLLSASLTGSGYAVCEVGSGKGALELMRSRSFDLVLLDLIMPEMDGFQVLKQMKSDTLLRDIPVVVVSASENMESVVSCLEMGAADHLSKPFDPVLLHVRIRAALVNRQLEEQERGGKLAVPGGEAQASSKPQRGEDTGDAAAERLSILGFLHILLHKIGPYKKQSILFTAVLLTSLAIEAALPLGFKFITDNALIAHNVQALILIVAVIIGAFGVVVLTEIGSDYLYARLSTKVLNDLRFNMYRHLQRLSLGYYQRVSAGEITSRFTTDLAAVESTVALSLPVALSEFVMVLFGLVLLFIIEWKLALFSLIGLYVSYKSGQRVAGAASGADTSVKNQQAGIAAVLQENVNAQPVVKIFRLQNMVIERFKHQMVELYHTASRAMFLSYLTDRVPGRSIELFGLLTIGAGAFLTLFEYLTIGELIAFQVLLTSLIGSVQELTWSVPSLVRAAGGMHRIELLLNEIPDVVDAEDTRPLPRPSREIVLRDVTFGYTAGRTNLKNVSLAIQVNQSVLLVGPSGCGKSTVLNLLMRFYDPRQGSISIDGYDLRTVQQDSLRQHMSVVLQENFLFNTSIRENIRLGKRGATDQEVEAAARAAQMHEIITGFPEGYDTPVGERGGALSGGQRQRLAIARAILSDPPVLLLDEATSALDPATSSSINEALEHVGKGRTVISVTHRLESAPKADGIFVFKDGQLVESGRHEELLKRAGLYAQLWSKQTGFVLHDSGKRAEVDPAWLRKIPILSGLDAESLKTIAALFVTERYPQNRSIVQEGDFGDRFYIIVRGRVAVFRKDGTGQGRQVAVLEDGDYFGEIALVRNIPRTAGIETLSDCIFLSLAGEHFLRLMSRDSSMREKIERTMTERLDALRAC